MEKDKYADVIRKAGFRATKPRMALLHFLVGSKMPRSIKEIASALQRKDVDQVTVYRTVGTFKKAGFVREINLRGEHPRYELEDEHDHHHVVCTKCKKVEDFTGCSADGLGRKVLRESHSFSKITGHSFEFYGLCDACVK